MKTNEKRQLAEVEKEYLGRVWTAGIDHEPGLEGFRYWVSERDGTICKIMEDSGVEEMALRKSRKKKKN